MYYRSKDDISKSEAIESDFKALSLQNECEVLVKAFEAEIITKETFEKAMATKYFKREPKPGGGYKYYYTEAQYKKEKGGGENTKASTDKINAAHQNTKENPNLYGSVLHIAKMDSAIKKQHPNKTPQEIRKMSMDAIDSGKQSESKQEGKVKITDQHKADIKAGKTVKIPITEKAWVRVAKGQDGYGGVQYRVQHVYNEGHNAGTLYMADTPEKAIKQAESVLKKEKSY